MAGKDSALLRSGKTPEQIVGDRDMSFVIRGMKTAVFAAMLWGIYGVFMSGATGMTPFNGSYGLLSVPVAAGFIEEVSCAIFMFIYNWKAGKLKEYGRSIRTKSGRLIMLGGVIGAPIALTGSTAAIIMCGPGYALCVTAMYPVVGSILSAIFLKEKTSLRFWIGVIMCVAGGFVLSYTPPEGTNPSTFYLGIAFAIVACLGWGAEGVISGYGTDTIDTDVGSGLRFIAAAVVYMIILPFVGGTTVLAKAITINPIAIGAIVVTSCFGALSTNYWYRAFGMTGVARALACNGTYGMWGIVFSAILAIFGLASFEFTPTLGIGCVISIIGIIFAVGNPKEMLELRKN
jgi:drug/metabolite transporter (DMT)-like permease